MTSEIPIDVLGVPILRVDDVGEVHLNPTAENLFGIGPSVGFAEMTEFLYGADADVFSAAIAAATHEPSNPVMVRWGVTPPVVFVHITTRRMDGDDVLVVAIDRTEQYRLDAANNSASGSALFFTDEHGVVTWVSPLSARLMATSQDAAVGVDLKGLVQQDELDAFRSRLEDVIAHPGTEISGIFHFKYPSVDDVWWPVVVTASYHPTRPAIGAVMIKIEPSVDEDANAGAGDGDDGATRHAPRMQSIAEITPAGIITAAGERLNMRNALARNLIGPLLDETDPYLWVNAVHEGSRRELLEQLRAATEKGRRGTTRVAVDGPDGVTRWLRIETIPTTSQAGQYVGYVATLLDMTTEMSQNEELRANQARLWELANHDPLTGLPNRMHFRDRLANALTHHRRENRGLALLYGDLDRFKPVNDTFGHHIGDQVLVEVAHRIQTVTRESDTVSRYGGDEFLVLCESFNDISEIQAVAERIIEVASEPMHIDGNEIRVGMSIGIAVAHTETGVEALLAAADQAMYEAKQTGRGRAVLAEQPIGQ